MNAQRRRKLFAWLFILFVIGAATLLVLYALRKNISLFYTPSELVKEDPKAQSIRLGGMVVKGTVNRSQGLTVFFDLTDYKNTVSVHYKGILPDLFREGQGIVALGKMTAQGYFQAEQVLAKHDANYMPKELKDALAKGVKNG